MRTIMIRVALVIMMMTVSCTSKKQPRSPRCPGGVDAKTGNCRAGDTDPASANLCAGNFQLKARGSRCVFHTANQDDCRVKGLSSQQKIDGGCYVRDINNQSCELNDVDIESFVCNKAISMEQVRVKVYLEVTKQGLVPKVIFDEQVEAGAELTIEEQNYAEKDLVKKDLEDGETQLTIPLKIPWKITYFRKTDKTTELCARGHLEGYNTNRERASQGFRCL